MKICIISGSHSNNSQSEKVANYLQNLLTAFPEIQAVDTILLKNNPIPLFDEHFYEQNNEFWQEHWAPYAVKLQAADGVIIVTPEWHGMVPAGLKNLLLLSSHKELGHKAGLLVSVSSGLGGAYPINELRISSYKNNRICYIPEHIVIRHVDKLLNTENPTDPVDVGLRSRIEYTCHLFTEYVKALNLVRASKVVDFKTWPNGM